MDIKKLSKFLIDSNKAGYAAGDSAKVIKNKDASSTIKYQDGDWKFHDNYFGGEPYGGREVIFFKNKPVWIMTYYGWVDKNVNDINIVYKFLQKALMDMPKKHPYRGPKMVKEGNLVYTNNWQGNIKRFKGEENIKKDEKEYYKAYYMGGLVDERA